MALSATLDAGLMGNPSFEMAKSRNMSIYLGRLTGTYGGAFTTLTLPIGTPYFVSIPPASNYAFQYNVATSMFSVIIQGASASNSVMATSPTSIDLSSFASYWNGTTSCGLPFIALGWG
jgi:hypothetical protein